MGTVTPPATGGDALPQFRAKKARGFGSWLPLGGLGSFLQVVCLAPFRS